MLIVLLFRITLDIHVFVANITEKRFSWRKILKEQKVHDCCIDFIYLRFCLCKPSGSEPQKKDGNFFFIKMIKLFVLEKLQ